jgi:hypothetical protein
MYIVFADTGRNTIETGNARGHFVQADPANLNQFGIFFNSDYAKAFAKSAAQANPGTEVYVLKQDYGMYNAVSPKIVEKRWTPEGEYVPV